MRRVIITAVIAISVLLASGSVFGESLWVSDRSAATVTDKCARKVGDILTVIIVESATSRQTAATDAKKNSQTEVSPGVGPLVKNIPGFNYEGGDSVKASGSTTRSMSFSTRMTVKVTEVEENGNLKIEGTRLVQTNKEKEEVKLTGTVRPEDVSKDNTILSTSIADAAITHQGSGPIGSRQKEGIVTRILRILF